MDAVERLDPDDEGFVCVDKHWRRIKIKQESYVLPHKMKDSIVERKNGVIEAIQNGEADDFVGTFPEFKEVFEETKTEMNELVKRMEGYYYGLDGDNVDPDDLKRHNAQMRWFHFMDRGVPPPRGPVW
jgi:hypothetical protein